MLGVRIHYLSGRCYAASAIDREVPEFPPHPFRFFSALVDALHAGDEQSQPEERDALLWLESLPAPMLRVPEFLPGNPAPRSYQPVNDVEGTRALPHLRTRKERFFPAQALSLPENTAGNSVWYIWDAEPGGHLRPLQRLAARVASLGHSMSLVSVDVNTNPPEPDHEPSSQGELAMRLFDAGLLERLEANYAHYARSGRRVQILSPIWQGYSRRQPLRERIVSTDSRSLVAVMKVHGRPLSGRHALAVIENVRTAVMAHWRGAIPAEISGHKPDGAPLRSPHLAIIPMLDAGHGFAEGHVGGVGFLLPGPGLSQPLHQTLSRIKRIELGPLGELQCRVVPPWEQGALPQYLSPRTYTASSRTWATLTPALLHRHPRRSRPIERIVTELCEQIGLPDPVEVWASHVSRHRGVPLAGAIYGQRFRGRPRVHLSLRFEEPICGPIVLGVGRYFGMGLMRPLRGFLEEQSAG